MQDIRKPYSHSKSNNDISARVERFERRDYTDLEEDGKDAVHIPRNGVRVRRDIDAMDMYPRRGSKESAGMRSDVLDRSMYRDPRTRYPDDSNKRTWIFIAATACIVIGVFLTTYVFNSATITITPQYTDDINLGKTFSLVKDGEVGDIHFILATSSASKTKKLQLSETKKVEAKASGVIIVYNKYSTEPQRLIKNTRFESASGKIYRINQSITIPGKKGDVPGSVEVTIYADDYGSEYNTEPTDFTIPGFKGSPQYDGFFARSKGSVSGGASGTKSLASLSDVNAAKDELALELTEELRASLGKVTQDGYTPFRSSVRVYFEDNEKAILSGDESTYSVQATGYMVLARSGELAQAFAKSARNYANESVRLAYTDGVEYSVKNTANISTDTKIDVLVEGNPRIIWNIDHDQLKRLLAGKNKDEFNSLLKGLPSIQKASRDVFPTWVSSFPDDMSHITVKETIPNR